MKFRPGVGTKIFLSEPGTHFLGSDSEPTFWVPTRNLELTRTDFLDSDLVPGTHFLGADPEPGTHFWGSWVPHMPTPGLDSNFR